MLWEVCSLVSLHSMCQMIQMPTHHKYCAFCVLVKRPDHTEQIGRAPDTVEDLEQSGTVDKIKGFCQVG